MDIYLDSFEGDYFAELPLRDFLINQFRLRYLQASDLVTELRQNTTQTFSITESERDFVCAALDRHGVKYRLQGQPPAKAAESIAPAAQNSSAPLAKTPVEKAAPLVNAPVPPDPVEYLLSAPKGGVKMNDKISFIKLLRESSRDPITEEVDGLKDSKDKADALCDGAQTIRHWVRNRQILPALLAEMQKLAISYHRIDEVPPALASSLQLPSASTPTQINILPLSPAAAKALSSEKLNFVKAIKMATGLGLKESKDIAEAVLLHPERSHSIHFGDSQQSIKELKDFLTKCLVATEKVSSGKPKPVPKSKFEVFMISEDSWNYSTGALSGQKIQMIKWLRTISIDPSTETAALSLFDAKQQVDALIDKTTPIRVEIRNTAQRDEFLAFVESLHLRYYLP